MRSGKKFTQICLKAQSKWRSYENSVCHSIQDFLKSNDCEFKGNSNFYEFVKGYAFNALESEKNISTLHKIDLEFILEALNKINDQTFTSPYRGIMVVALIEDIKNNLDKHAS